MKDNPLSTEGRTSGEDTSGALSAQLQEQLRLLERLLIHSQLLVFVQDLAGRLVYLSPTAASVFGIAGTEVGDVNICDLGVPDDVGARWEQERDHIIRTGQAVQGHVPDLGPGGATRAYHYTLAPVHNTADEVEAVLGTMRDVTAHEAAASRYRRFTTADILGVTTLDENWHFTEANDAFLQIIGYTQEELQGSRIGWDRVTPPEWHAAHHQLCQSILETGSAPLREKELLHKDGTRVPVLVGGARLNETDSKVIGFVIDLTAQKQAERQKAESIQDYIVVLEYQKCELEKANAKLETLASQDGLTGLKNQRALAGWLDMAFEQSVRYQTPLSLVMLDVDHFKSYNDAFGHPAGNAALQKLAQIVQEHARKTDFVARYGGEEFVIVLPQTDAAGAVVIAERIRAAIADASWEQRPISASFGIATLTTDMPNPTALLAHADAALYRSKAGGRNRITLD